MVLFYLENSLSVCGFQVVKIFCRRLVYGNAVRIPRPNFDQRQLSSSLIDRFLNTSCSGRQIGMLLFCLVSSKSLSRPCGFQVVKSFVEVWSIEMQSQF